MGQLGKNKGNMQIHPGVVRAGRSRFSHTATLDITEQRQKQRTAICIMPEEKIFLHSIIVPPPGKSFSRNDERLKKNAQISHNFSKTVFFITVWGGGERFDFLWDNCDFFVKKQNFGEKIRLFSSAICGNINSYMLY
ncbi:MAG: hypothetical protein IKC89_05615 [Lentisphaeria bacterium]|nr:hypothetical protein [Lentisphaeria bacterium]